MNYILKCIVVAFLWTCLYLFSWCFARNIPSFFMDTNRTLFFIFAFIMEIFYAGGFKYFGVDLNRRGVRGVPFQDTALLITLLLQTAVTMIAAYSDAAYFWKMPEWGFLRTFGLILFVISGFLMIFSALSLKQYFSRSVTVQQDHKLVTTGLYMFIRHPWYLGVMLWGLGVSFVFLSVIGLGLSLVLAGVYFWRINEEEKFMAQEFGVQWTTYRDKTKKIMPFLC